MQKHGSIKLISFEIYFKELLEMMMEEICLLQKNMKTTKEKFFQWY